MVFEKTPIKSPLALSDENERPVSSCCPSEFKTPLPIHHKFNDRHQLQSSTVGFIRCLHCREKNELSVEDLDGLEPNLFLASAADRMAKSMSVCGKFFRLKRLLNMFSGL